MIRHFRGKEAERIFRREPSLRFGFVAGVAKRKLDQLHAAVTLNDLRAVPGNRLEALRGDRAGQFSIRVNEKWRICFRWDGQDAFDVEIVDYH